MDSQEAIIIFSLILSLRNLKFRGIQELNPKQQDWDLSLTPPFLQMREEANQYLKFIS